MMENAQLIGLSRQIALQRQMDVVANNVANINTTGFKSEQMLFDDYMMPVARDRDFAFADQPLAYTQDWATIHDLSAGSITQTGNPLDLALQGSGFFAVETPEGEKYTRAGSFQIDASGILVDLGGNAVLSQAGPLRFLPSETDISISADGAVNTSDGIKGYLRIVEFERPQDLQRDGDNLFSGGTPELATESKVLQGSIERSNVSGVSAMADMIRVQRSYQSLTSLMQRQDDIRRSAIQRLGDVQA